MPLMPLVPLHTRIANTGSGSEVQSELPNWFQNITTNTLSFGFWIYIFWLSCPPRRYGLLVLPRDMDPHFLALRRRVGRHGQRVHRRRLRQLDRRRRGVRNVVGRSIGGGSATENK